MTITFGSVCSGIGAPEMAWRDLGWHAAFASEIEPSARAVFAHHWPEVKCHGDFTTIQAGQYEPIDLLVGGTPCQDFSVAGLRAGIEGMRGNLTLEFIEVVKRLQPHFVVFENVPGLISLSKGEVFGYILDCLNDAGYAIEADILDAQHHGVPQRRQRIFLVCHHIQTGRNKRSSLFAATALSWMTETLLGISAALIKPSKRSGSDFGSVPQGEGHNQTSHPKTTSSSEVMPRTMMTGGLESALAVLVSPFRKDVASSALDVGLLARGLMTRMKLLGLPSETPANDPTWTSAWGKFLRDLDDAILRSQPGPGNWDFPSDDQSGGCPNTGAATVPCKMENVFLSIVSSWSKIWDEAFSPENTSTTSISTRKTTIPTISLCAEALLNTGNCITSFRALPASLSAAASLVLTVIEGFISYARQVDNCLLERSLSGYDWADFAKRAEIVRHAIERHIRDRGHPGEILPLPQSLRGDPPPRRETGQGVAASLTRGADSGGRGGYAGRRREDDVNLVANPLGAKRDGGWRGDLDNDTYVTAYDGRQITNPVYRGNPAPGAPCHTLHGGAGDTLLAFGGNNTSGPISVSTALNASRTASGRQDFETETFIAHTPSIFQDSQYGVREYDSAGALRAGRIPEHQMVLATTLRARDGARGVDSDCTDTLIAHTLAGNGFDASCDGTGRGTPLVPAYAINSHAGTADGDQTNRSHANGGPVGIGVSEELAYSLRAGRTQNVAYSGVRRLTPKECCRLQGFRDDFFDGVTMRGKPLADGPKYRLLGNSMAVPILSWLGRRIEMVEAQ